jgi:hypothetical protein
LWNTSFRVGRFHADSFPQAGSDCYRDDAGAFLDAGKAATLQAAAETENSGSSSARRKVTAFHGRVKFTVI